METKVKGSYLFIFQDDAILLFHDKGQYRIPYLPMDAFSIDNWLEVSTTIDNEKSFTAAVDNTFPVPKDFTFFKLRTSFRFLTSEEYKAAKSALLEGLGLEHLFDHSHELTPKEKEIWMLFDRVDVAELLARDAFAKGAYMLGAEDREIMLK